MLDHRMKKDYVATKMWTNTEIQQDVLHELDWEPEVSPSAAGVEVDEGVTTLTGAVESCTVTLAAQDAAQHVVGARAVANDLSVLGPLTYNDTDIAKAVVNALNTNCFVPLGCIEVTVQNGLVTLTGEVNWAFQHAAASSSVRYLRGVRDLINLIVVQRPKVTATEVQRCIEHALLRATERDAERVHITTVDGHVTLSGTVRSLAEKRQATFEALRAKGVAQLTNNIEVRPFS